MARKRNPLRDEAYRIWIESNKEKLLKDIAEELGVSPSTVRKWKSEDKWDGKTKRSAPNQKERYDSMKGNQNAKGNSGGGAPKNNQNAVSHGLFAKWLPEETAEIMETIQNRSQIDMLWDSIMFQYTAILRAQKIMFVEDKDEMIKELKKEKEGWSDSGGSNETEWEFQFAWDRHASFMNAQSRAMSTLSNLIKQFISIADDQDERRLKLELMQGQINKLKGPQKKISDVDWKEALRQAETGKFGEIEDE